MKSYKMAGVKHKKKVDGGGKEIKLRKQRCTEIIAIAKITNRSYESSNT